MFAVADSAIAASSSRLGDSVARALAKSELEAQYLKRERDILLQSQAELQELLGVKDEECRLLRIRAEAAERRLSSVARVATRPVRNTGSVESRVSRGSERQATRHPDPGFSREVGVRSVVQSFQAEPQATNDDIGEANLGSSAGSSGPGPTSMGAEAPGQAKSAVDRRPALDEDALLTNQLQVLASIRQAVVDIKEDLSYRPQV